MSEYHPYTEEQLIKAFHEDKDIKAMGIKISMYKKMPLVKKGILMNVREKLLESKGKK